ncbi:MAG: PfkB family carbohydrate kinase, partial [Anaerolineae bacterium]|nr:PfkB family carbohydrate kinase [Anaerolineae bacterium]
DVYKRQPSPEMAPVETLAACRVLFVDHTVAAFALEVVPLARRLGIPVVADLERVTPEASALLPMVDHLVVGEGFAQQVTGSAEPAVMVRRLMTPGRTACVVTAGERGCWYAGEETGGEVRHQPALRVLAVDTTGCGDVFHGAYAAMLARGEPLARAVAVATVAAGLKATQPGGRSGIPDWNTVAKWLRGWKERP